MKPIIIIPALNPNRYFLRLVNNLSMQGFTIVAVDDGSDIEYKHIFGMLQDKTNVFIRTHDTNLGKGAAIKTAIAYIKMHFRDSIGFITADADGQHSTEDILRLSDALEKNPNSIFLGTREFEFGKIPLRSYIGNKLTSLVYYMTVGRKCADTQTGLRCIPMKYADQCLKIKGNRYEYEMNFLIEMGKKRVDMRAIPISTLYFDDNWESHFNPVQDSARIYYNIFKYSFSSIISAVIDLLVFTLGVGLLFGTQTVGIFFSTSIARFISGNFNFLMNKYWVFGSKNDVREESKGYIALFLSQMILSWFLVNLFRTTSLNLTVVKMCVDSVLFCGSYIIQKKFIFAKKQKERLS